MALPSLCASCGLPMESLDESSAVCIGCGRRDFSCSHPAAGVLSTRGVEPGRGLGKEQPRLGHSLLDGESLDPDFFRPAPDTVPPLKALPSGWRAECGRWQIHDGWICGSVDGEQPAALWRDHSLPGDHLIAFQAFVVPPHANDINCYWEGSGGILGEGESRSCTIGGVGGWWTGLTGIEQYPAGGLRAVARSRLLQAGRIHAITAGRRGSADFLFVDGVLMMEIERPSPPRRKASKVALATWNSHVHFGRVAARAIPDRSS